MMIFMPIALFVLTLPVFDLISILEPLTRGNFALGLLALPIFLPLMIVFSLTFGYCLIVFGQMFVASALGEPDHPGWPEWDSHQIAEGLGRWVWAAIFGAALGGFPIALYWKNCGNIDWFDITIFVELGLVGASYALMAIAAALLHDSVAASNPFTVISAIFQVGWDYVQVCLTAGMALLAAGSALWAIFFVITDLKYAFPALWGFWILVMYETMVVLRMMGLTYHAHAEELVWFQGRPKWGTPARFGRIYSNS